MEIFLNCVLNLQIKKPKGNHLLASVLTRFEPIFYLCLLKYKKPKYCPN